MSITAPLRKIGKVSIQQMLAHRKSRSAVVDLLLSDYIWKLPDQIRRPILLHVSDYTRHHPEFFDELRAHFGAKNNDEFQSAFWGSGFGWMLEDSDEMFSQKYGYFREATRDINASQYVDVGCGRGSLCLWTKKQYPNAKVIGLDVSKRVLKIAEQRAKEDNLEITFLNASASELADNFSPRSIDMVSCTDAFYYIEDGLNALRQMSIVARKCIFVTSPMGSLSEEQYVSSTQPMKRFDYDLCWIHPLVAYARELDLPVYSQGRISANCFYIDIRYAKNNE